jgi:hypothetical protein
MNSEGSDALATAVGSGHRDPKSLTTYVHASRTLKTKAALTIGKATIAAAGDMQTSSGQKRSHDAITADHCSCSETDDTDDDCDAH